MKKQPTTLADLVLRDTYRKNSSIAAHTKRPVADVRDVLIRARRFSLDREMSGFAADLATAPFRADPLRRPDVLDSMRHSARLPFPITWIELDSRAFRDRLLSYGIVSAFGGRPLASSEEVPPRWGWLLEEHPKIATAVRLTEFADFDDNDEIMMMPFSVVWQTTDDPLPWHADRYAGMISHGITGYLTNQIGVIYDRSFPKSVMRQIIGDDEKFLTHDLVVETAGIARYALALLATLDDVPTIRTAVRQDRGFVARGRWRRFLDHEVIKLTVPARVDLRRLARKIVVAARRRAHMVRGHWRVYDPGDRIVEHNDHDWSAPDAGGHATCATCHCQRTWIDAHQRGDARLGWVTHDFEVSRDRKPRRKTP